MIRKVYYLILIMAVIASFITPVYAQVTNNPPTSGQILNNVTGPDSLTDITDSFATTANYSRVGISDIISTIIKVLLGFLGIIFLGLIISSGFRWMTASGNDEQVKKAQNTLQTAIIGLIIVLMAYGITYFIFNNLPFDGGSMPNAV